MFILDATNRLPLAKTIHYHGPEPPRKWYVSAKDGIERDAQECTALKWFPLLNFDARLLLLAKPNPLVSLVSPLSRQPRHSSVDHMYSNTRAVQCVFEALAGITSGPLTSIAAPYCTRIRIPYRLRCRGKKENTGGSREEAHNEKGRDGNVEHRPPQAGKRSAEIIPHQPAHLARPRKHTVPYLPTVTVSYSN